MTLRKQTKSTCVLDQVRLDILTGVFSPGERLSMDVLKKKYKVGYSPLREALCRLTVIGFVNFEDQCGFYVAKLSLEELFDLYKIRAHIETLALTLSVKHGDDYWEANVLACWHRYAKFLKQINEKPLELTAWNEFEKEFSFSITSACKSAWLLRMQRMLYDNSSRYRYLCMANNVTNEKTILDYHEQCNQLVKAVLSRNIDLAIQLLNASWDSSLNMMAKKLSEMLIA
ncbi:FCD domain-containing protein [Legionella hackeliae]|nr:FCD domain-containing protein [Legionella hackeliae]